MRSAKLLLFERARRARFRAAICRELAAATKKAEAVAILEQLARDFEAAGARLEREARQMPTIKALEPAGGMDALREGIALVVPPPSGDGSEEPE